MMLVLLKMIGDTATTTAPIAKGKMLVLLKMIGDTAEFVDELTFKRC